MDFWDGWGMYDGAHACHDVVAVGKKPFYQAELPHITNQKTTLMPHQ